MPIYEYLCKACAHRFEYLHRFSSPAATCPVCQSTDLEQLISTTAFYSEGMAQANLSAQHRKVAAARGDRNREEHRQHHEHFEDTSTRSDDAPKSTD